MGTGSEERWVRGTAACGPEPECPVRPCGASSVAGKRTKEEDSQGTTGHSAMVPAGCYVPQVPSAGLHRAICPPRRSQKPRRNRRVGDYHATVRLHGDHHGVAADGDIATYRSRSAQRRRNCRPGQISTTHAVFAHLLMRSFQKALQQDRPVEELSSPRQASCSPFRVKKATRQAPHSAPRGGRSSRRPPPTRRPSTECGLRQQLCRTLALAPIISSSCPRFSALSRTT